MALPPLASSSPGSGPAERRTRASSRPALLLVVPLHRLLGLYKGSSQERIIASGYVEATSVRVGLKVGGTVREVKVREGERVAAGTVLAEIDTVDLGLALAVARADQEQAAADLRLRLAGSRPEEIREAAALETRASAELAAAERTWPVCSRCSTGDRARRRRGRRADAAGPGRGDTRRDAGTAPAAEERLSAEEIEAARARESAASARVAQIDRQLQDARVVSPLDGVVTEKLVEPGELLPPGAAVCVVADLGHPWLSVYIGERDLSRVRLGDPVAVRTGEASALRHPQLRLRSGGVHAAQRADAGGACPPRLPAQDHAAERGWSVQAGDAGGGRIARDRRPPMSPRSRS